jgi:hypothetical protein
VIRGDGPPAVTERAFEKHAAARVQWCVSAMEHASPVRPARRPVSPARRLGLEAERRDEHARCAECKTPAFNAFGDHVALRAWILEHRKALAAELRDYFRKNPELHARPDHWFGLLTAQLRGEVALAWEGSALAAAHGIPLARLAALRDDGTPHAKAVRAFAHDGFVALVCAACRSLHARTPLAPPAIRQRYATWFFDGDLAAAEALDPVRWALLEEAIACACAGRASASEG